MLLKPVTLKTSWQTGFKLWISKALFDAAKDFLRANKARNPAEEIYSSSLASITTTSSLISSLESVSATSTEVTVSHIHFSAPTNCP